MSLSGFLKNLADSLSGTGRQNKGQAGELGAYLLSKDGSIRAWGQGFWIARFSRTGQILMHDRAFAVSDKRLAWGLGVDIAYVEVDFREKLVAEIEQVEDGSWTVALIPDGPDEDTDRYPSLFNFARVIGGDLKDSYGVARFLLTKFGPYPSMFEAIQQLSDMPRRVPEPASWITAYCEVLTTEFARVEYPPRMVIDADEEGLTVSLRSDDPSFDLEWSDVYAWEPSKSSSGEPAWLLILDPDSTAVPPDVWGLKVIEVHSDDVQRWKRFLDLMPSDEEE